MTPTVVQNGDHGSSADDVLLPGQLYVHVMVVLPMLRGKRSTGAMMSLVVISAGGTISLFSSS